MCGIAGRVNVEAPLDAEALGRVCARLRHRGPDGSGIYHKGALGLIHTRLAIVDLAQGQQPMTNEDDTVAVVCNGEIYNHATLRRELEPRGHVYRSRSDTEAVVHGYESWGDDVVGRLRGMFALAVWDERRRRLLLARDRVGIKPLYYAILPSGDLAFASELRALLGWRDIPTDLDDEALALYLALRYVPGERTALLSVRKLEPGTLLSWENGAIDLSRYWDLDRSPCQGSARRPTFVEAAAELRDRIDESVSAHLMSDVPLGVFLSGGVDSTLIAATMARLAPDQVQTFAIGYDDPASELPWARRAALAIGTHHHEVLLDPAAIADELDAIVGALDEPIADPAAVPLHVLSRAAREHVKVVLSGEGGDEVFAGYVTYQRHLQLERLGRALGAGPWAFVRSLLAQEGQWEARRPCAPPASGTWARLRLVQTLLAPLEQRYIGVARGLAGRAPIAAQALAPLWERSEALPPLRRMLYLDTKRWLADDLLMKADKMTMAHALELRVPLLDHTLLEWAWRLPWEYLPGKRILKQAARGRVPASLLERKKSGFAVPVARWLRGPWLDWAHDRLFAQAALCPLGRKPTQDLLERHRRDGGLAKELWPLVVLEAWWRELSHSEEEPIPVGLRKEAA